jgi:hypothetical protein
MSPPLPGDVYRCQGRSARPHRDRVDEHPSTSAPADDIDFEGTVQQVQ